eukprot:COSAG06_NODE_3878_length_4809_cov_166.836306_2_plen_62_part_00
MIIIVMCNPQAAENVHPVLALELTVTVSGKPHCTGVYANQHLPNITLGLSIIIYHIYINNE